MFRSEIEWTPSAGPNSFWGGSDVGLANDIVNRGLTRYLKSQSDDRANLSGLPQVVDDLYQLLGFGRPRLIILDSPKGLAETVWKYNRMMQLMDYFPNMGQSGVLYKTLFELVDRTGRNLVSYEAFRSASNSLADFYRIILSPSLFALRQQGTRETATLLEELLVHGSYELLGKTLAYLGYLDGRGRGWMYDPSYGKPLAAELLAYILIRSHLFIPTLQAFFVVKLPVLFETEGRLNLDSLLRLHNERGPIFTFRDDFKAYAYKGFAVQSHVIEDPKKITINEIINETNVEQRRIKLERYGFSRFMLDAGAKMVDEYKGEVEGLKGAKLYEILLGVRKGDVGSTIINDLETLKMVSVVDCTPENGVSRVYFLRVPPTMATAEQAVAWTWGLEPEAYKPIKEA